VYCACVHINHVNSTDQINCFVAGILLILSLHLLNSLNLVMCTKGARDSVVVKVLCYKVEVSRVQDPMR
jgi:hypothetical protein